MKIILHNLLASVLALLLLRLAFWMVGQFVRETTARMNALFGLIGDAYRQSGRSFRWPGLHRAMPYVVAIGLLLVAFKASAAAPPDVGILDNLVGQYKQASLGWFNVLYGYAQVLFGLLAALEFTWAAAMWVLEKDSMQSWMAALVRKIMSVGFFYALLIKSSTWIPAIIDSLVQAGQTAGNTGALSPSNVVSAGVDCAFQIMQSLSNLGLLDQIAIGLIADACAVIIMLCFVWIACHLAVALIESYIAISANVLFLGFGGSRWTTDFTSKVLNYAFATGVKLFMMYLIIGLGMQEANNWASALSATSVGNNYVNICLYVLSGSVFFAYIATKIPSLAASLLTGTPSMTAGEAAGTVAGMVAGAAALTAAAVNGKSIFGAAKAGQNGSGPGGSPALAAASGGSISNAAGLGFGSSSGGSSAGGSTAGKAAMVSPPPVSGASSASSGGSGNSPALSASQPPSSSASAPSAPASAPPAAAAAESAASAGASSSTAEAASEESDAPPPVASVPPPALPSAPAPASAGAATAQAAAPASGAPSKLATGSTDKAASASSSAPAGSAPAPSAAPAAAPAPASAVDEAAKGFGSENAIGANADEAPQDGEKSAYQGKSLGEAFDTLRNELPNDQTGGGTVHIKLDHSHD
ncbi:MAG: P-type conjugative transfer protein TrbL [Rhodocyclaceae bacterium]|nr:P-type conjugative transfer protein TrbL [Rhodocyclaceae bacterium]